MLIEQSYAGAKVKVAEQKAQRDERHTAKRAERVEGRRGLR